MGKFGQGYVPQIFGLGSILSKSLSLKALFSRPLVWFLIALALRLLYLSESSGSFQFYQQMLDEQEVAHTAGHGFGDAPLFKAPLYPLILRGLMAMGGEGWIYSMRLFQHLLGALLVVVFFDVTWRLTKQRLAAVIVAAAAAFYGPMIRLEDRLILDFLVLFLQSVMLWALVRSMTDGEGRAIRWLVVATVFAGLSWLNRPTILPVLPFIALWVYFVHRRSVKSVLIFLSVPIVVIAGFTLRNGMVSGEALSNPWQGGYNFYLGNNADANGRYIKQMSFDVSASGNPTEVHMTDAYTKAHETETDFEFSYQGLNKYWYGLGKEAIADDPVRWLGLMVQKALYLVTAREIYNFEDYSIQRSMSLWLKVGAVNFGLIWPLAFGSLAFVRRRGEGAGKALMWLYIILLGGAIGLFFCSGRLRMPLMFPVTLLAAVGVVELVKTRKWKLYLPLVILGGCMSWVDWWGVRSEDVGYVEYARLSNVAWHAGDYPRALELIELAAASKHNYPAIPQLRGQALYSLGRVDEALDSYMLALRYLRRDPIPPYSMALIYYREKNEIQAARKWFVYSLELDHPPARVMLARAELKIAQVAKAQELMEPVLKSGLAELDLQALITAIFLFEATGENDLVSQTTQLLAQRFGAEGMAVFEEEIGYYKQR